MRFLQPSVTAPVWGFASAGPSLNRMVGVYGQPTILPVAHVLPSSYPPTSAASELRSEQVGIDELDS